MKTSNKILFAGLIVLLISVTFYNFELKAEFEKGEYKNEFYLYNKLYNKDFDEIEVNAGNLLDLKIIQADKFDIRLRKYHNKPFKVSQKESRLIIDVTDSLNSPWMSDQKAMVIFCPDLRRLKIKGQIMTYHDHDSLVTGIPLNRDSGTELKGFKLDSLYLEVGSKSRIKFSGNNINYFNAIIGGKTESGARLTLNKDNAVKSAVFQINGENELNLADPKIGHLNYIYSNEATIALTGSAHSLLKK